MWKPLTKLSEYFKECSSTLRVDDLLVIEKNIHTILCKLERIVPPGLFNSMEHLPIQLAYKACVCGPIQYGMGSFYNDSLSPASVTGDVPARSEQVNEAIRTHVHALNEGLQQQLQ